MTYPSTLLRPTLPLAALLALAACSEPEEQADPAPGPAATESVIPEPHESEAAGADTAATVQVSTIPAAFQGVWGYGANACDDVASELKLEIRPTEIEFYESLGTVTSVEVENPQSIVVALDMSGEGETWELTNRFVLSENGTVLTPLETEDNPQYDPMPRKKCTS